MDKQALVGKLPLYVGYHWDSGKIIYHYNLESISNEKDQEWNKIVVDILWEVVPNPMILLLNYNTNYLPALIFEGVSKFKFDKRKPLCYTYVIILMWDLLPADTRPSCGCLHASKRQCTQHCADKVLLLCWYSSETIGWGWRIGHNYAKIERKRQGRGAGRIRKEGIKWIQISHCK